MKKKTKHSELLKSISDETSSNIMIVDEGDNTVACVKGSAIQLGNLLKQFFDNEPDMYKIFRASIKAYESLEEFKQKTPEEQFEELIKKLGKTLN